MEIKTLFIIEIDETFSFCGYQNEPLKVGDEVILTDDGEKYGVAVVIVARDGWDCKGTRVR